MKYKNAKVTLHNLLKEKIEKNSKLQNNFFRGINRILPNIKNLDYFSEFFNKHLHLFFKYCRISSEKVAVKILLFLFMVFKHDLYSKVSQRYLNLLYDYINNQHIL